LSVTTQHPNHWQQCKRWKLVRDIIDNNAMCHLRTVDPNDPVRSCQYKEDAVLTNFTRLTRDGLKGLVFRKDPVITLPPELGYLEDDVTGENLNIEQTLQKLVDEVQETGRVGLLADYPKVQEDLSDIDRENAGLYSRIKIYKAENIENFKHKYIGSKYVPSVIVLTEWVNADDDDMFCWNLIKQYRVLYLDNEGYYTQMVYSDQDELIEPPVRPVDYDGNWLREIPFVCIGSENNDLEYDSIPLYDLAILNRAHYQNSADAEEASFVCGQPMLGICVGDSDAIQFAAANPNGVKFGSRAGVTLANGGQLQLVQANPNILPTQMMEQKEVQAAAIGARLISPAGGRETAEAARIRYGAQNSSLYIMTSNISEGMEQACKWVARFQGANPEVIEIELNKDFYEDTADPNLIVAQMQMLDKGVIAKNDVREYGRKTGFIDADRTNEQLEAESSVLIEIPPAPAVQNNSPEGI